MGTTGQSITLANSIIGVGILAMPFCFQQCGVLLATLILLFMGLVSRLCCYFLLKSALIAKKRNFEYLAFHVFGSTGKFTVELGIIGFLMGTCIAYFVVVGDLGPQIISKMFNINQSDMLRTCIMVIVSVVCVLPLGLLRNVDSLSNVSAATIGFYFCLVLKVIIEATSQMSNEWPSQVEMWKPSGVLQCVPIFSMALFCQTQLFEIFESMPSLSLEKMNLVTKNAINICTGVYFTLGLFGYIAFSSHNISGNILMSLKPTMASDVIKLGFVMSVAFSFPLIIFPCRASLYSFLFKKVHLFHHDHIVNNSIPERTFRCITVAIIAGSLLVSLMLPNIELVLGLVGSTIGVMICVIFPAACFVNVTFKNTNERVLAKGIMALGLVIMVLGTYANLQAAETELDRYDDKFTQERIDKIVEDFFESKKFDKVEELDVIAKPEKDPVKSNEDVKVDKETVIKDSEVQPPNPVPPDSLPDEKIQRPIIEKIKEKKGNEKPEILKQNEIVDSILDSHPKNLKGTLIDEKLSNGIKSIDHEIGKPKDVKDSPSDQEKIDRIKQQQLIETIKQHGKEQKELIKEQKEILDEIIKTKKEMQQKKEVDSIQAKKIAVESIQKIANMAIQSISGVSEKPSQKKVNGDEKSQNIANEAVQEIAKKAVETLEAIKDEKVQEEPALKSVIKGAVQTDHKIIPQQNVESDQKLEEAKLHDTFPGKIIRRSDKIDIEPVISRGEKLVNQNIKSRQPMSSDVNKKNPEVNKIQSDSIQKPQDSANLKKEIENEKVHSPLSDEPFVYKQGENSKKINVNPDHVKKDIQEMAIPDANNPNKVINSVDQTLDVKSDIKVESILPKIDSKLDNLDKDFQINPSKESMKDFVLNLQSKEADDDKILVRQKREVVDCTEKASLKPEDKEICKSLLANPVDSYEILPKVDLSNAGLPNNRPLYQIRSLKNFDETKEQ